MIRRYRIPSYEVILGIITLDNFMDPAYFKVDYEQYLGNAIWPLSTIGTSSGLLLCLQIGCDLKAPTRFSGMSLGLEVQYKILLKYFHDEVVTQELTVSDRISPQFVNDTTKLFTTSLTRNFFSMLGVLEHPFLRGSVHIKLVDLAAYPQFIPRHLSPFI